MTGRTPRNAPGGLRSGDEFHFGRLSLVDEAVDVVCCFGGEWPPGSNIALSSAISSSSDGLCRSVFALGCFRLGEMSIGVERPPSMAPWWPEAWYATSRMVLDVDTLGKTRKSAGERKIGMIVGFLDRVHVHIDS